MNFHLVNITMRSPVLSLRHLVNLLFYVTCTTFFIRILTTLWIRYGMNLIPHIISPFPSAASINLPRVESVSYSNVSSIYDEQTHVLPNTHLSRLLRCHYDANSITNAIRLPHHILNITTTPPNSPPNSANQYFNPALIPLPSYSPYPYLLLSRLVTAGFHQESHICLAILCLPSNLTRSHSMPADSRACDASDNTILGPQGGIRCATTPQNLNIPPTPAFRCTEAWAAFPDIPGFHDPRVFWSGKGEPLVLVNSASRYACVGLWVIDLRAIYPELRDLLSGKGKYIGSRSKQDDDDEFLGMPARMSYPHLTELTRVPRKSRGAVEKNWILFFPKADESWIQYDIVTHGRHGRSPNEDTHHKGDNLLAATGEKTYHITDESNSDKVALIHDNNTSLGLARSSIGFHPDTTLSRSVLNGTAYLGGTSHTHAHSKRSKIPGNKRNSDLIPSRSLAKIIGSGYTTPNLTSPNEVACLESTNILDSLGNRGHWHQGSNSLRLILCSRQDAGCLKNHDEHVLVKSGKVIHFAVLHRKFSNDLDLPMRYERHMMAWEARFPFRMIGISQYPILFSGERAQPWSKQENGLEGDGEAEKWKDTYFTYTPSLAWAWRKDTLMHDNGGSKMGLGTGYLGDEVILGIGMDDVAQGFVRVKVEELLQCLRLCPGFNSTK